MENNNRYLTTWEKRMKKAIEKQVEEEIQDKKDKQNTLLNQERKRVIVWDKDLLEEDKFRRRRTQEYEDIYRRNRTLKILKKCGLNEEEYLKTWIGSCVRANLLLQCVQDKIDGFDYNEEYLRVPNNKKMNVSNMVVDFQNDTLSISDENNTYVFKVDEHQLIYINDELALNLNKIPTREEINDDLKRFSENMRADRLNHETAMQKSLEDARTFWIKD